MRTCSNGGEHILLSGNVEWFLFSSSSVGYTFYFWCFWLETAHLNLDKFFILCYLNCISECINGFTLLKNI
jgi:hypothetical protein